MEPEPTTTMSIIKLIIDALTPIVGGLIAWRLTRIGKDMENRQWASRQVIEKRLQVYEQLAPQLNELYCFFAFIGNWKELSPMEIIQRKRFLDKHIHINAYLFDQDISVPYEAFIATCFQMYAGMGKDARLKTAFKDRKLYYQGEWNTSWEDLFVDEPAASTAAVKSTYKDLVNAFRRELSVHTSHR